MDYSNFNFRYISEESKLPHTHLQNIHQKLFIDVLGAKKSHWDLIVNLSHSNWAKEIIDQLTYEQISGLIDFENGVIQGRWAQTFFSQLACEKFSPFTPYFIFYCCIIGQSPKPVILHDKNRKKIFLDTNSLPVLKVKKEALESVLKKYGGVVNQVDHNETWSDFKWYIGGDLRVMKIVSSFGVDCVAVYPELTLPQDAPVSHAYVLSPSFDLAELESVLKSEDGTYHEWTQEYMSCAFYQSKTEYHSLPYIFYCLDIIVFSFINNLTDIHLSPLRISSQDVINLKNHLNILLKIKQLNLFAIKELKSLFEKVEDNTLTDQGYSEVTNKLAEIDELTEKSLHQFPNLDFLNYYFKISKTSAPGSSLLEIAKSLTLIYHDYNQVIDVYEDLIQQVLQGANHDGRANP